MSTPPSTPPNKFVMPQRVADVEKLSANNDTAIRELTARFDRLPPRGEKGETGPKGERGERGADCICKNGRDGKDSTVSWSRRPARSSWQRLRLQDRTRRAATLNRREFLGTVTRRVRTFATDRTRTSGDGQRPARPKQKGC